MKRRSSALVLLTAVFLLGSMLPASASILSERCGARWKADDSQALRWCIAVNYNDTTGNIESVFHYSDLNTGDVYRVWVGEINLWRRGPDGDIALKASCGACPTWEFVYDGWNEIDTGWVGYLCNRDYWADVTFRIQWNEGGAITDDVTRLSGAVSLC